MCGSGQFEFGPVCCRWQATRPATLTCGSDRKAIKESRAASSDELLLATTAAHVRRVPGCVSAAGSIVVAEHRAARAVARIVVTRVACGTSKQYPAERIGACENVVLIRRVATSIHRQTFLVQREFLVDAVAVPVVVAVKIGHVPRDERTLRVVPRATANAI